LGRRCGIGVGVAARLASLIERILGVVLNDLKAAFQPLEIRL